MPISAIQYRNVAGNYTHKSVAENKQRGQRNNRSVNFHSTSSNSHISDEVLNFNSTLKSTNNAAQGGNFTPASASPTLSRHGNFLVLMLLLDNVSLVESVLPRPTDPTLPQPDSNRFLSALTGVSQPMITAGQRETIALPELPRSVSAHQLARLPRADAVPQPRDNNTVSYDKITNSYLVTGEQKITALIGAIKNYLVADKQLTEYQGNEFEFNLRKWATDGSVRVTPVFQSPDSPGRVKRISEKTTNELIAEHIKNHCAYQEDLLNANGENQGKLLLFQALRAENPFRIIYDNTDGGPSPEARGAAEGINFCVNVMTLGMKSIIGALVANAKREKYFRNKGDAICEERFKHLSFAQLGTSLAIDSLTFSGRSTVPKMKSTELMHVLSSPEEEANAVFYTSNPVDNSRIGFQMKLKQERVNGMITDDYQDIYLKATDKDNEFITWYPHATKPELLERKVIVDEATLKWRFADSFDSSGLDVQVMEGRKKINLQGDWYELNMLNNGNYEIVVQMDSGSKKFIPVYMEPIAKTWHLPTHNGHDVFSPEHIEIINAISVKKNNLFSYRPEQNRNPRYYGSGKIYRTELSGDSSHFIQGYQIEINGKLVPVRHQVTPGHGVHYEACDINFPLRKGHAVQWDGERWLFESDNSIHVSPELIKQSTPTMYVKDIDASQLSAPDTMGLRWSADEKTYLKVNKNFIQLHKLNGNRYCIHATAQSPKMTLRFRENKFYPESFRERIENILTVGLGGRKRTHAVDILKQQDGFTEEGATTLLSGYRFPETGFYSEYSFALDIEQTGVIPAWSGKFKKTRIIAGSPQDYIETITLHKSEFPQHKIKFKLGGELGEGTYGTVYTDADDNAFVIKKYFTNAVDDPARKAAHEADSFRRYYGEGSAQLLFDGRGDCYLRMYRIPGQTVGSLGPGTLPANAIEKYVDMLEKLNNVGVLHDDLSAENILWDAETQSFNPIDMNNIYDSYHQAQMEEKTELNEMGEDFWDKMLELIEEKQLI